MKTYEFFNQEIYSLVSREAAEKFNVEKTEKILKWIRENRIEDEDELDDMEDFLEKAQKNDELSALPLTSFVLNMLRKYDEFEIAEKDHASILEAQEQDPNNKLLHLLRVISQLEMFEEQEFSFKEKLDFLKDILNNHGYLIKLEDIFENLHGLLELLTYEGMTQHQDEFLALVEFAAKTYPEKVAFKHFLGTIYHYTGRSQEALEQFSSMLDIANAAIDNDSFYNIDANHFFYPFDLLQYMALCYDQLGKDEQTQALVNEVIDNIPIISGPDDDDDEGFEDITSYLDSFLLRMRINIKSGNMELVFRDWVRIKDSFWDISYFEEQYPDVFKVVYEDELQGKYLKD